MTLRICHARQPSARAECKNFGQSPRGGLLRLALPDWAENRGLGYFCFCRAIKILDPRVANFWATFKKPLADLCAFLMQIRQKKNEKTVKKQADMVVYCPYLRKWV